MIERLKEEFEEERANWKVELRGAEDRIGEINRQKDKIQDDCELQKIRNM